MAYQVGDKPRCTLELRNAAGELFDPTTVKLWFVNPLGTQTTYTYGVDAQAQRSATGIYYMDVSLTMPGTWVYGAYSEGTGQAASPDYSMIVEKTVRR